MNIKLRELVRSRAGDCCEYCRAQAEFSHDPFSIDHIVPQANGGADDQENLAWACLGCNNLKAAVTIALDSLTQIPVSIFDPRREQWDEHFHWSPDTLSIIGDTPTGRATVAQLQLNRPGLVNLRRVLRAMGEHPPAG